jgi:two-component system, NtrC family, sensor kinase
MKLFNKITRTLGFKLFILLIGVLAVLFGVYAYSTISNQSAQMMDMVVENATATTDLIRSSIHYSMMVHRKEDAYQIIEQIGREPQVVDIRLYNKQGVITYSTSPDEIKATVDIRADACVICHDATPPVHSIPHDSRWRIFQEDRRDDGITRILELTTPIENEASCYGSGCHPSPDDVTILGVLDVMISLDTVDKNIASARRHMVVAAVVLIIVVSTIFGIVLLLTVRKPVKKLAGATREVAAGNLDFEIQYESNDELGDLARSFNIMTRELKEAHREITEWSDTLEEKVRQKTEALRKAQSQLIQIEKMASLGKLSASVAHELNNPLEGILTYSKLIAKRLRKREELSDIMREMLEDVELIISETERCGNIVKNLLLFSRKQVGEFETVPIRQIVDKAIRLIGHHLKISKVELETHFEQEGIALYCNANQVQQALIALFVNAVEAMPDGGTLRVDVEKQGDEGDITLRITDTGAGIAEEDIPHIFEPFFTRKTEGKGVGLGLSIVYGIIERHGGRISVESLPGKGTAFTIEFPATAHKDTRTGDENDIHDKG